MSFHLFRLQVAIEIFLKCISYIGYNTSTNNNQGIDLQINKQKNKQTNKQGIEQTSHETNIRCKSQRLAERLFAVSD